MNYSIQGSEPRTREEIEAMGWIIDEVIEETGSLSAHVDPKNGVGYIGGVWQVVKNAR